MPSTRLPFMLAPRRHLKSSGRCPQFWVATLGPAWHRPQYLPPQSAYDSVTVGMWRAMKLALEVEAHPWAQKRPALRGVGRPWFKILKIVLRHYPRKASAAGSTLRLDQVERPALLIHHAYRPVLLHNRFADGAPIPVLKSCSFSHLFGLVAV